MCIYVWRVKRGSTGLASGISRQDIAFYIFEFIKENIGVFRAVELNLCVSISKGNICKLNAPYSLNISEILY